MPPLDRISCDPPAQAGGPRIRGMPVTVRQVLEEMAAHRSYDEVLRAYPDLEEDDIRQALSYAAQMVSPGPPPVASQPSSPGRPEAAQQRGKTIWERIDELIAGVPPEEFRKLPADGSVNHDHYLYGWPKKYP